MGVPKALIVARTLHILMLGLLIALVVYLDSASWRLVGVVVVAALLAYEHSLVASDDTQQIKCGIFTMNGVIAVVFFVCWRLNLLMRVPRP